MSLPWADVTFRGTIYRFRDNGRVEEAGGRVLDAAGADRLRADMRREGVQVPFDGLVGSARSYLSDVAAGVGEGIGNAAEQLGWQLLGVPAWVTQLSQLDEAADQGAPVPPAVAEVADKAAWFAPQRWLDADPGAKSVDLPGGTGAAVLAVAGTLVLFGVTAIAWSPPARVASAAASTWWRR